jgi:hypothetical protein
MPISQTKTIKNVGKTISPDCGAKDFMKREYKNM